MTKQPRLAVGHAHFFENFVVFGNPMELGKRKKRQLGKHLGTVKAVIPVDPYHVLYQRYRHTPAFIQRQKVRKHRRKVGLTRLALRFQKKLM